MKKNKIISLPGFLLLSILSVFAACTKHEICFQQGTQVSKIEYYDISGTLIGKDEFTYTDSLITTVSGLNNNFWKIEYNGLKQISRVTNHLIGVPFPIVSYLYEYNSDGNIIKITSTGNDANGIPSPYNDVTIFSWNGGRLNSVRQIFNSGNVLRNSVTDYKYSYAGFNISKCVFNSTVINNPAPPRVLKDSLEFGYDNNLNYLTTKNKYAFFTDRFGLAAITSFVAYLDPNPFDPYRKTRLMNDAIYYSFAINKNNIIKISTNSSSGESNNSLLNYFIVSGGLSEIRTDGQVAAKYFYR